MNQKRVFILTWSLVSVISVIGLFGFANSISSEDNRYVSYTVDPREVDLKFYLQDGQKRNFGSIGTLKSWLEQRKQKMVFAMNGGMYKPDGSPQGLFIQNSIEVASIDTGIGAGNFYLKPNGVFFLTATDSAFVCSTGQFYSTRKVKYATQSGPMLLINGKIHPAFTSGSKNLNIRNGVGILPGNRVVFAMSKTPVNFYDFAVFFKMLGCKDALYLDGLVSRTYLPEQGWEQIDGHFGVIIAVTSNAK